MINYNYLILDQATRQAAVIDPAWEMEPLDEMVRLLGAKLSAVLLTHAHFDHIHLVEPIQRRYGDLPVFISRTESHSYNYQCPNLKLLDHCDTVPLGETTFSALLTPGHTAGGMCYLLPGSLFAGDTVFMEGCGQCTAPGASAHDMYRSIQLIKRTVPGSARVYPAHSYGVRPGLPLSVLQESNIYLCLNDEALFVNFRMRPNQRIMQFR